MMASSRWFLAALLLIAVQLDPGFAANSTSNSNNICTYKDSPGFQLNLTGAMIFPEYLLLIDGDLMVYKVPQSNYGNYSYGSMLLNISGVYIEDYWPALKGNKRWEAIKPLYKMIYHFIDGKSIYVYMDVLEVGLGFCYNLVTKKPSCPGWNFASNYSQQQIIDEGEHIYAIEDHAGIPFLTTWKYIRDSNGTLSVANSTWTGRIYYSVETKKPTNRNVTIISGYSAIITPSNDPLLKQKSGWHMENITDWHLGLKHIPVGYLYDGYFHLYDLDKVMVFQDVVPSFEEQISGHFEAKHPDGSILASSSLKILHYREFFKCDKVAKDGQVPTYPPSEGPDGSYSSTTEKDDRLGVIIAIVMAVLVIIICCIGFWCCCFGKKSGKEVEELKKEKKEKNSKHSMGKAAKEAGALKAAKETVSRGGEASSLKQGGGGGSSSKEQGEAAAATSGNASKTSQVGNYQTQSFKQSQSQSLAVSKKV